MRRYLILALSVLVLMAFLTTAAFAGDPVGDPTLKTITAHVDDYSCNEPGDPNVWGFTINQIENPEVNAPKEIRVWYEGLPTFVTLTKPKIDGPVAHYEDNDPDHLNRYVVKAEADIYVGWGGEFNLSHGPCKPTAVTIVSADAKPLAANPYVTGLVILLTAAAFFFVAAGVRLS